jgi:hypothetical protein
VAIVASATAVVLSLGPETALYRFLHEHVVLVRGIRALERFALVPVLALAVLSGLALAGRRRLAIVALPLLLAESCPAPLRLAAAPPSSEAARWLARGEGAVAFLPLGLRDTEVMLDSVEHFRPLVNGDSGFIPRSYDRAMELCELPLTEDAMRFLRAVGVRHVVTAARLPLPVAERFADAAAYDVPVGDRAAVIEAGRSVPTLWTPDGPLIDLGAPIRVDRITFTLGDGPWVAEPRVWYSTDGEAWSEVRGNASLADATLSLTRDPVAASGAVSLPPLRARFVRLDAALPARRGALGVAP